MRAPTGTRIEETTRIADAVESAIREMIPADQLDTILDNIGLPNSGINLSYSNAGTIGTMDAEILMSLKKGMRRRTNSSPSCAMNCPSALRTWSSFSKRPTSRHRF